jgi:hypothetical protein
MQKVVGQAYRRLYESKALRHIFFPRQVSRKEKRKISSGMPFFKTFTLRKTLHHIKFPFFPLIPCRHHGKKREKYGQAFPFSKPLQ